MKVYKKKLTNKLYYSFVNPLSSPLPFFLLSPLSFSFISLIIPAKFIAFYFSFIALSLYKIDRAYFSRHYYVIRYSVSCVKISEKGNDRVVDGKFYAKTRERRPHKRFRFFPSPLQRFDVIVVVVVDKDARDVQIKFFPCHHLARSTILPSSSSSSSTS